MRSKKEAKTLAQYLDRKLICFLNEESRDGVIDALVERLDSMGKLPDRYAFRKAIFQREEIVSTGIGMGVAIPHAKMETLSEFFLVIGIQTRKGVDWNALDQGTVRIIFMIGGPDNRQSEYLQLLSLLTSIIRDPELRKKILKSPSVDEVFQIFQTVCQ